MNEISDLKYTLIYIIHGDDSYLYHDKKGNSKNADEMKTDGVDIFYRPPKSGKLKTNKSIPVGNACA
ncbi:hypothetical protein GF337_13180 [candidate division KSB1 bacterium]|nr:hypothetical protein [candidate division KSB1 bacterium]